MKKMKPEEYEQFVHNQIKELLTDYGPITMLWFDIPWDMGPDMSGSLARLYAHCKSLQPDCLILLNQGFVDGSFVEKRRAFVFRQGCFANAGVDLAEGHQQRRARLAARRRATIRESRSRANNTTSPTKSDDCIGQERWFWGPDDGVRPARQMYELYKQSVGRGSNLLLNAGPDKTGRIPAEMVQRLREIAQMIAHPESVQDSLLVGRPAKASNVYRNEPDNWGPQRAVDMDIGAEAGTRWATDENVKTAWLEVDLGGEKTFDRATLNDAFDRRPRLRASNTRRAGRLESDLPGQDHRRLGRRYHFPAGHGRSDSPGHHRLDRRPDDLGLRDLPCEHDAGCRRGIQGREERRPSVFFLGLGSC